MLLLAPEMEAVLDPEKAERKVWLVRVSTSVAAMLLQHIVAKAAGLPPVSPAGWLLPHCEYAAVFIRHVLFVATQPA